MDFIIKFENSISSLFKDYIINSGYNIIIIAVVMLLITFLPTLIAVGRSHEKTKQIFVSNVLFFWTYTVWFGLLFWATYDKKPDEQIDEK
jgi:Superinfection immunity protein